MMSNQFNDMYQQLARQMGHWSEASMRLSKLEELASPAAWIGLEHYLNVALKNRLEKGLENLQQKARLLGTTLRSAKTVKELTNLQEGLNVFKKKYLQAETMVDFYTDAINTRTNTDMVALLKSCDTIAQNSMAKILEPLKKKVPPVLTYIDKGLGASILKAGLRLWDGRTMSPVAAIKIVRHNLYRPTALIHEAGHQVAHILGWNSELAEVLLNELTPVSEDLGDVWAGWASEIAADTFAFVHTGFAAVAGLHDVVAGDEKFVLRYLPMDPHPISYLRVLLGITMCRVSFGKGPWDQMERVWLQKYDIRSIDPEVQELIRQSLPNLTRIANCCLHIPMKAFGGRPITYYINPKEVAPAQLSKLVQKAGAALHTSDHWISKESIRLLALGGYRIATNPDRVPQVLQQQRRWMLRLGSTLRAA